MIRVTRSAVIDAPIERVWEVLRDFNSHTAWHPVVAESEIEGGEPSDQVGCVRRFTLRVALVRTTFGREERIELVLAVDRARVLALTLAALGGYAAEDMTHDEGWRLLGDPVGRRLLASLQRMGRSELAVPIISTQLVTDAHADVAMDVEHVHPISSRRGGGATGRAMHRYARRPRSAPGRPRGAAGPPGS